jgi:hypothetical protein
MENCTCHASVLTACAQLYLCLYIASNTQHLNANTARFIICFDVFFVE